ncbi:MULTISPECIES: hypothetical protein [Kitasatospora]|uniref:Uncharacterized protein n=2 Tax=Kitasatospora TaxID=2063 RepID=A0ABT1J5Q4_9ACTN|nr:hypothetical protein [Kitasatospora paracochleata]MCP2312771.1 hypothetical protein [Kitasatospora paracochleata]
MATIQKFTAGFSGFQVNRPMLAMGAVLTGVGAIMGMTGTVMVFGALASAGRSWVRQMDTPPTELAQRAINQARAASLAGLEAWRNEGQVSAN